MLIFFVRTGGVDAFPPALFQNQAKGKTILHHGMIDGTFSDTFGMHTCLTIWAVLGRGLALQCNLLAAILHIHGADYDIRVF